MIYFTSDTHFNHANIIRYCNRPFWKQQIHPAEPDPQWMNQALIDNWNETVGPDDEVYFLGDWAMGNHEKALSIRQRLNGRIIFIPGNHDKCWSGRNEETWRRWEEKYYDAGFDEIVHGGTTLVIEHGGELITNATLSHFPYVNHDERKFKEFRPEDDGGWLLHGHVHDSWQFNGRQINVGTDVWDYKPVSMDTIGYLIRTAMENESAFG